MQARQTDYLRWITIAIPVIGMSMAGVSWSYGVRQQVATLEVRVLQMEEFIRENREDHRAIGAKLDKLQELIITKR